MPQEHLGFQVRGGFPAGPVKLDYAFFFANAPKLVTDPTDDQKDDNLTTGNLDFDSFADPQHAWLSTGPGSNGHQP